MRLKLFGRCEIDLRAITQGEITDDGFFVFTGDLFKVYSVRYELPNEVETRQFISESVRPVRDYCIAHLKRILSPNCYFRIYEIQHADPYVLLFAVHSNTVYELSFTPTKEGASGIHAADVASLIITRNA